MEQTVDTEAYKMGVYAGEKYIKQTHKIVFCINPFNYLQNEDKYKEWQMGFNCVVNKNKKSY